MYCTHARIHAVHNCVSVRCVGSVPMAVVVHSVSAICKKTPTTATTATKTTTSLLSEIGVCSSVVLKANRRHIVGGIRRRTSSHLLPSEPNRTIESYRAVAVHSLQAAKYGIPMAWHIQTFIYSWVTTTTTTTTSTTATTATTTTARQRSADEAHPTPTLTHIFSISCCAAAAAAGTRSFRLCVQIRAHTLMI